MTVADGAWNHAAFTQQVDAQIHELHLQARRAGVLSNTSAEACFEIWDANAWYGDMTLLPHLMSVFGLRGAMVEITFHEPVQARDFAGRKALTAHCHRHVTAGVTRAHRRRVYDIPADNGKLVEFRP